MSDCDVTGSWLPSILVIAACDKSLQSIIKFRENKVNKCIKNTIKLKKCSYGFLWCKSRDFTEDEATIIFKNSYEYTDILYAYYYKELRINKLKEMALRTDRIFVSLTYFQDIKEFYNEN